MLSPAMVESFESWQLACLEQSQRLRWSVRASMFSASLLPDVSLQVALIQHLVQLFAVLQRTVNVVFLLKFNRRQVVRVGHVGDVDLHAWLHFCVAAFHTPCSDPLLQLSFGSSISSLRSPVLCGVESSRTTQSHQERSVSAIPPCGHV